MARKTKTPKFFAHEEMMAQWEKAGRVSSTELSIRTLVLDEEHFQARVGELDAKHVSDLEVNLIEGRKLAPIIVFEIDGKNVVGDGFHRTNAHVRHGKRGINAKVVKDATRQEAVEYATCCNMANMSKKMGAEDKKKAVMMLLANGWLNRSVAEIGRHAGPSKTAVTKYRAEHCEKSGEKLPTEVVGLNGKKCRAYSSGGAINSNSRRSKSGFQASLAGRTIRFSAKTEDEARDAFREASEARKASIASLENTAMTSQYLSFRGIWLDEIRNSIKGVKGGKCRGFALTFISEDLRSISPQKSAPCIVAAVGRAVLLGEHYGLSRKVVLVFEPIAGHETLVLLARRLGVEFMTLDEFVEVAKADQGDDAQGAAVSA